ncbi:hypothetical protein V5799_023274 [Amblyomma americanum]|uniref:Uncharacterized protein n=1 Tax=Amblyomma americanum TaxID=6943 RepID=A0AAQ4FJT2_AMBAM
MTPEDLRLERIMMGLKQTECGDRSNVSTWTKPNMCADQFLEELLPRRACVPAGINRDLVAVVQCPEEWVLAIGNDASKVRCESENSGGMELSYLDDLPAPKNGAAIDIGYSLQSRNIMFLWDAGKPKAECSIAIKELQKKCLAQDLIVTDCIQKRLVMTCPEGYPDSEIRDKCHSYASMVKDTANMIVYRSIHCAICNGRSAKTLSCYLKAQQEPERRKYSSAGESYAVVMNFSKWHSSS